MNRLQIIGLLAILSMSCDKKIPENNLQKKQITKQYILPKEKREVTIDDIAKLEGFGRVIYERGEKPKIIYIAHLHENPINPAIPEKTTISSVKSLCFGSYDKFGVNNIIYEGLDQEIVDRLNFGEKLELKPKEIFGEMYYYFENLNKLWSERHWNFLYGEKTETQNEINPIRSEVSRLYQIYIRAFELLAYERVILAQKNKETISLEQVQNYITNQKPYLDSLMIEGLDKVLTSEKLDKLYNIGIYQKSIDFAKSAINQVNATSSPVIVVLGGGAHKNILRLLSQQ